MTVDDIYIEKWSPISWCYNNNPGMWIMCDERHGIDTIEEAREMMESGFLLMANRRDDKEGKTYLVVRSTSKVVGLRGFNLRMAFKREAAE